MNKKNELLVITMEECGELTQACSKIIRKGDNKKEITALIDLVASSTIGNVVLQLCNISFTVGCC